MKKTKQKIFTIINLLFDENDKKNHIFNPFSTVYQAFVRYMVRSKKNLKKMRHRAAHSVFLSTEIPQKVFAHCKYNQCNFYSF